MRSGASSYCTRLGYRVAAGGEPLTPRHAHVEHPQQNRTLPRDAHCRRTSHAMVVHAQSVSGRQHLPDACQSEVNNMAWPRKGHVGQPQVPIQLTPRPHRELQRMSDNPRTQMQPAMAAPHMPMQTRLAAWPRRDLERSGMPICNLRHARAARRTRPDNNFLTYDTKRGGNSPLPVEQSGQQFLTLITKGQPQAMKQVRQPC